MVKRLLYSVLCLVGSVSAQWYKELKPAEPPRLILGGDYGVFRISHKDFEQVYKSRWGDGFGGFAAVRFYGTAYAAAKYGYFYSYAKNSTAKEGFTESSWEEKWLKAGVRFRRLPDGRWGSYYGFGAAFYFIDETGSPFLLADSASGAAGKQQGSGFYMEAAVEYLATSKAVVYLEAEVASGGIGGLTGFEEKSIGGWRFAAGLSVSPF
ncbi:MAG: hypothetical protein ONB12_00280 [candidate division KSB1 bacterium]|nr:hypothetical protein [candidate division KSB1 bacterium]